MQRVAFLTALRPGVAGRAIALGRSPARRWACGWFVAVASLLAFGWPQPGAAQVVKPSWSGDFTLTLKGAGTVEVPVKGLPGGKSRVTWRVDRVARGRIVLDRTFQGAGMTRTPDSSNTERYETWVATGPQLLEMEIDDEGSYFGFIPSGEVALDVTRFKCPMPDARHPTGQVRASILQFDRKEGTYTFETPRMIHRCATSTLRTPRHGSAAWMAKPPFELRSNAYELEFEVWHGLGVLDAWNRMSGPWSGDARELVLSRRLEFQWSSPLSEKTPVEARLELVLRKSP